MAANLLSVNFFLVVGVDSDKKFRIVPTGQRRGFTSIHRDTIMRLAARVGRGCAELHVFNLSGTNFC
jgi:hypothetical protein